MSKIVYKLIWDLSEFSGIGLGKYAPYVFHQMLGIVPGVKIENNKHNL